MPEQAFLDRLERELSVRISSFGGVAGAALLDLTTGARLGVNASVTFPAASTIKVHLLTALVDLHERGEASLDERTAVTKRVPGSGVLAYLDDEVQLTWRDLANLMILVSDNTATNMIIEHVGLERMSGYLERWGLGETRIARAMQDHEASARGIENTATPADLVSMLRLLWQQERIAPAVASQVLAVLRKPKVTPFSHGLPKGVVLANKSGGMDRVRGDMGIVELKRRPFAMAVLTKYGALDAGRLTEWVAHTGRLIYDAMAVLDTTSEHGQGIVAAGATAP